MNKKVELVLKKHKANKPLTSKDVGTLLLACIIQDLRKNTDPSVKSFITQEEFNRVRNSLSSDSFEDYLNYKFVCTGLINTHTYILGLPQQFYHGYYRITRNIELAFNLEKDIQRQFVYPYILSDKEERKLKKEIEENIASQTLDYVSIFISIVLNPPGSIKPYIEKLKTEKIESERIISTYGSIAGYGEYILKGKPGEYSQKEIEAYVSKFRKENAYKIKDEASELLFRGFEYIKHAYEKITKNKVTESETEVMQCLENLYISRCGINYTSFNEAPEYRTIPACLQYLIEPAFDLKWEPFKYPPESVTKYDVLIDKRFYDSIADIEQDYPELYTAVYSLIRERYPKIIPGKEYSYRELAKMNFLNCKELDPPVLDKVKIGNHLINKGNLELGTRLLLHGLLPPYDSTTKYLFNRDESYRDFTNEYLEEKKKRYSVLSYDNETIKKLNMCIDTLCTPAINTCLAYNTLLEILAEVFDLSDFLLLKVDTSNMESLANGYNNQVFALNALIKGDDVSVRKKREIVKKSFPLLRPKKFVWADDYQDTAKAIKETFIKNPVKLENLSSFLEKLK